MNSTNAIIEYGIRLQSTTNAGLLKEVFMKNSKKNIEYNIEKKYHNIFLISNSGSQ